MYGTVMIGTMAEGITQERVVEIIRQWATERAPNVPGYEDQWVMFADDGRTVVSPVRFTSKEDYLRLAEDPDQHAWWRENIAPLFAGHCRWIDGTWHEAICPDTR